MAHPWRNVPQRLNAKRKVCATEALVEGCANYTTTPMPSTRRPARSA
jgi:hypothetical protein